MSSASDNTENNQDFMNHNGKHTTSTPEKIDNNGNGDFRYSKEKIEPVNRNSDFRYNNEKIEPVNQNGDFRYNKEKIEPVKLNGDVRHNKEINMTNGTASCECESGAHPKVSSTTQINGNYKTEPLIGNSRLYMKYFYFSHIIVTSALIHIIEPLPLPPKGKEVEVAPAFIISADQMYIHFTDELQQFENFQYNTLQAILPKELGYIPSNAYINTFVFPNQIYPYQF